MVMDSKTRYLLILACSRRKCSDVGLLSALDRYDGGSYRVLRKAKREGYLAKNIDILIISAKYGPIEVSTPIADYQQRMNSKRASQLKPLVIQALKNYVREKAYRQVYVDLGQDYSTVVEGLEDLFSDSTIIYARGRIGERLKNLKNWLKAKFVD